MEEKKILFVQYCADDFLGGTSNMDPMTELAYRRICDMIYSTEDNLLDNDSLQFTTKTGRQWKKIRKELIETYGKITIIKGFIRQKVCSERLSFARQNIDQKSRAGKASAEARKSLKDIETASTGVATPVPTPVPTYVATPVITAVPTNHKPLKKKEVSKKESKSADAPKKSNSKDDKNSPDFDPRWFDGDVIRLRRNDYREWFGLYDGEDDQFMAWLSDRDDWLASQPPEIKAKWFITTRKMLEKFANELSRN